MKKIKILMIVLSMAIFSSCDQTVGLPEVIEFVEPDYTALWLLGNAVPAGWSIDNPTPMIVDEDDPFVFTWEGPLVFGEFKIPTATGDWGCDYFMPETNGEEVSSAKTSYSVTLIAGGNPDNKWAVTEDGNYLITLNIKKPVTLTIVKQ